MILIQCCYIHDKQKLIKVKLKELLRANITGKDIAHSSSSKCTGMIGESIDSFINCIGNSDGDTLIIIGELESNCKFTLFA